MTMTVTRVLVAVDFSEPSRAALALAAEMAAAFSASLDLLHVVGLPIARVLSSEGYVPLPEEYRGEITHDAETRLKTWLAEAPVGLPTKPHVLEGHPAAEIVRYANEHNVDMIVMGTHGRTGASHLLMGSVAESVVRTAHCPVLTTHGKPVAAA